MGEGILQTSRQRRGLSLDPRTKLLLLVTVSTFVLGGLGGDRLPFLVPVLCLAVLALLLSAGKYRAAAMYLAVYAAANLAADLMLPRAVWVFSAG